MSGKGRPLPEYPRSCLAGPAGPEFFDVSRRSDGQETLYPAMVRPPDTLITWPVMKSASLLARNATRPG